MDRDDQTGCLIWLDAGICVKCLAQLSENDLYLFRGRCV